MWSAGTTYGTPPLRLSLQGTRHHLNNFIPQLLTASSKQHHQIYCTLLKVIVHKAVPERPGRSEARVQKRRPKAYPFMTKPRHELRKQLQTAKTTSVLAFLSAISPLVYVICHPLS